MKITEYLIVFVIGFLVGIFLAKLKNWEKKRNLEKDPYGRWISKNS